MNLPHVSIIMPCYNAAAHLARSVGSVQAQTFDDWELVAIDDGSGDDTAARLAAMAADDPRIRVFTQPNGGVSRARNRGLSEARGRCIAFLDADDDWHPDFLARMTGALQAEPDAVLAYCGWQNIGLSGGRAQPFVPPDYETPDKREKLFAGCRWPIHATLTRREAVTAAGGFDTALKNAEDYAMWLRIAGRAPITRVAEVLAFYHFHSGTQASSAHARAALDFADAQLDYLADHPDFTATLDANRTPGKLAAEVERMLTEAKKTDAAEDHRFGEAAGDALPSDLSRSADHLARLKACQEKLERAATEAAARQQAKIEAREHPSGTAVGASAAASRRHPILPWTRRRWPTRRIRTAAS